jgi:hypothetical protein
MDVIVVLCPEPAEPEVDEDWLNAEAMAQKKKLKLWYQDRIWENVNICFSDY